MSEAKPIQWPDFPGLPELPEPTGPQNASEVFDWVCGNMCSVEFVHPQEGALRPHKFDENDIYTMSAHDIASVFSWSELFSAEQMLAYARQAVMAERERCAQLAESDTFYGSATQHLIADAIRAGERPIPEMTEKRRAFHKGMSESGAFTVEAAIRSGKQGE